MNLKIAGKISGGVGLVILLTSPFSLLTSGSGAVAAGKAVLGAALIAAYFATHWGSLGRFASKRSTFFFGGSAALVLLTLAALVAVNYVAAKRNKTWDFTRKRIYSLSPQTVATLRGLKEPVHAIGFLQTKHPDYPRLAALFQQYQREAPDRFDYAFKDPAKNPDLAAKYQLRKDQTTVVITRGEGKDATHAALQAYVEQDLTNALLKLNSVGEQKVYFLVGHGEWSLDAAEGPQDPGSVSELKRMLLQEGYSAQPLNLAGQREVPTDAALLVLAGPKSALTSPEIAALRSYLAQGGRALYFTDANTEAGLDALLAEYGIQVDPGVVADNRFAVDTPYRVLSVFYGDHEMVSLLKRNQSNVEFPTSRGLTLLREGLADGVKAELVVLTSPNAWEETTPNDQPAPSEGEKTGTIPLVIASTRTVAGAEMRSSQARLVVFGDSELLLDANWGGEANRNLVLNAFAWASNQVNKVTLRPPDRDISTVDLDEERLARVRFFATDLFPLGLLGMGLAIWIRRRNT